MSPKLIDPMRCWIIPALFTLCSGCTSVSGLFQMSEFSYVMPQHAALVTQTSSAADQFPTEGPSPWIPPATSEHQQARPNDNSRGGVSETHDLHDSGSARSDNESAGAAAEVAHPLPPVTRQENQAWQRSAPPSAIRTPPIASQPVLMGACEPFPAQCAPCSRWKSGSCSSCGERICLPPDNHHARQIQALLDRVEALEKQLKESDSSMAALKKELMHANQEVRRLRASVAGWQGEVQRLEATMKAQHELDIASLTRISDLLGGLIESELDDVGVEESSQDFEFDDAPVDAVLQEFETDNGDVDELMDVSEPDDVLVPEVTP